MMTDDGRTTTDERNEEINFDEAVNTVHRTEDYDKFQFNEKNRNVNGAHVSSLVQSIREKNLLHGQPILVNADFEIIDGQHRFTAAKKLDVPVYYIVQEDLQIEDAITLNINTRNWSYRDYLQYWIKQGKWEYVYFKKYMEHYGFGYAVSLALLGLGQAEAGNKLTPFFNEGKFWPKYIHYARDLGDKILEIKEYGNFVTTRSFVLAFDEAVAMDGYDHDTFMRKLEMAPNKFHKCSDTDSYLRMMEDVINYHNRGDRIRLY